MNRKLSKILFIEGTSNEENGKLRQGYNKLLSQKLSGKMPRIKMADGKNQAIQTFKKSTLSESKFLLIDLDKPEKEKENEISSQKLENEKDSVFFMIQEMEAWFLSQPEILDKYFKTKDFSKKVKRPAKEIPNPADFIHNISKNTKKKGYHKVEDGTALLELLDANKLEKDFNEFKKLVEKILKS